MSTEGLDLERLHRIEDAANDLVNIARAVMPEHAACGHDKAWLLDVFEHLIAVLAANQPVAEAGE